MGCTVSRPKQSFTSLRPLSEIRQFTRCIHRQEYSPYTSLCIFVRTPPRKFCFKKNEQLTRTRFSDYRQSWPTWPLSLIVFAHRRIADRAVLLVYAPGVQRRSNFILRIEDTDLERSTPEAIQQILDGLEWARLVQDEVPSIKQSALTGTRMSSKSCSPPARLIAALQQSRVGADAAQQIARGEKPRYDGHLARSAVTRSLAWRRWCDSRILSRRSGGR